MKSAFPKLVLRCTKVTFFVLVTILVLYGLSKLQRERKLGDEFPSANLGMSMAQLKQQLGDPWKVAACGSTLSGDIPRHCHTEILYRSPFAPLVPEYWAYRFDQSGRLLDKYNYVSP